MTTCERNDIVYILATECTSSPSTLLVGYTDQITQITHNESDQITHNESFICCYLRYVYNGEEIYEGLKGRYSNFNNVREDNGYVKMSNRDYLDVKYLLDLIVKCQNDRMSPPSYEEACRGRR